MFNWIYAMMIVVGTVFYLMLIIHSIDSDDDPPKGGLYGTMILLFILQTESLADRSYIVFLDNDLGRFATGTILKAEKEGTAILLTCNHVIQRTSSQLKVVDGEGPAIPILPQYKIGSDATYDVAAFEIPWNSDRGTRLAKQSPGSGGLVRCGGAASPYREGTVLEFQTYVPEPGSQNPPKGGLYTNVTSITMDSGSPFLNNKYEVIGLLSEKFNPGHPLYPTVRSHGADCNQIRSLLSKWGWDCTGGICRKILHPNEIRYQQPFVQVQPVIVQPPNQTPIQPPITPDPPRQIEPKIEVEIEQSTKSPTNPPTKSTTYPQNRPPVIQTEKEEKGGSAIPWGTIALVGLSAAGVGIPTWALTAYKGAKTAKNLRNRLSASRAERRALNKQVREKQQENGGWITGGTDGSRIEPPTSIPPAKSIERTVTVDGPRVERHWIDTDFVGVENDAYQRANERARQQIARKYPNAITWLEMEKSLTSQYLAGGSGSTNL